MISDRLKHILLEEPTGALRFFFGFGAIGYALALPGFEGYPMYSLAFHWLGVWWWCAGFAINGVALVVGSLTNKPGLLMYYLEGILGLAVWLMMGLATALAQGMPGPTFFASFIAIWIYVRYPEWK